MSRVRPLNAWSEKAQLAEAELAAKLGAAFDFAISKRGQRVSEVAAAVGLSARHVNNILSGRSRVILRRYLAIAGALGMRLTVEVSTKRPVHICPSNPAEPVQGAEASPDGE